MRYLKRHISSIIISILIIAFLFPGNKLMSQRETIERALSKKVEHNKVDVYMRDVDSVKLIRYNGKEGYKPHEFLQGKLDTSTLRKIYTKHSIYQNDTLRHLVQYDVEGEKRIKSYRCDYLRNGSKMVEHLTSYVWGEKEVKLEKGFELDYYWLYHQVSPMDLAGSDIVVDIFAPANKKLDSIYAEIIKSEIKYIAETSCVEYIAPNGKKIRSECLLPSDKNNHLVITNYLYKTKTDTLVIDDYGNLLYEKPFSNHYTVDDRGNWIYAIIRRFPYRRIIYYK